MLRNFRVYVAATQFYKRCKELSLPGKSFRLKPFIAKVSEVRLLHRCSAAFYAKPSESCTH
jgi:hypothetical protein